MDNFVSAYAKSTGVKQRIPRHWIGHPVLGRDFELTPSAKAAVVEELAEQPAESWLRSRLDDYAADLGLDTTGLPNKGEVLAAINTALADVDTTDPDGTPPTDETPATGDTEEE